MKCVGGNFYGTELLASGVSFEPQGSKDIAEIGYVAPSQCLLQSSLGEFTTTHTLVTGGNAWDMSLRTQRKNIRFYFQIPTQPGSPEACHPVGK